MNLKELALWSLGIQKKRKNPIPKKIPNSFDKLKNIPFKKSFPPKKIKPR